MVWLIQVIKLKANMISKNILKNVIKNYCRVAEAHKIGKFIFILFSITSISFTQNQPEEFFKSNCSSCHTIGGGKLTGPDLKNIHNRKSDEWIKKFINDPSAVINSGDNYALKILDESRGIIMPKVGGLTPFITESLLELIKTESAKEKSIFGGSIIEDRPLTVADITLGSKLFNGTKRLKNNGPACIACHSVNGEGLLGGGLLGPDLTRVYGQLGGKNILSAWLASPASETMAPIYKKHPIDDSEVLPLVAFFKEKDKMGSMEGTGMHDFNFMIVGLVGLIIMLVSFDIFWGHRLKSIRKKIVKGIK
jgi:mono/diheme cytochrome c family protein